MAAFVVGFVLLLAMAVQSDASYCLCNPNADKTALQKNIDYACGNGADCNPILQNGACYNPNTLADHCSYAVNSYYQRRQQYGATCDFQGTATLSQSPPNAGSGCTYQSTPSTGGSTTPTTGGGTTPTTGGTPNMGGGSTTIPGTNPGTTGTTNQGFGLGPTGSGLGNTDSSSSVKLSSISSTFMVVALLISGCLMMM